MIYIIRSYINYIVLGYVHSFKTNPFGGYTQFTRDRYKYENTAMKVPGLT
jgi:hypothetical protein